LIQKREWWISGNVKNHFARILAIAEMIVRSSSRTGFMLSAEFIAIVYSRGCHQIGFSEYGVLYSSFSKAKDVF
jgi:hypothetical protein